MKPLALVWFRLDLRWEDNAALARALREGFAIVPVFIWAPEEEAPWAPGAASRWWLHHALADFDQQLRARGLQLIRRRGPSLEALRQLVAETGAQAVFWNRRYEAAVTARDQRLKETLKAEGLAVHTQPSYLLHEPWTLANGSGQPYRVYTPYSRAAFAKGLPGPVEVPTEAQGPQNWPASVPLESWQLLPRVSWDGGFYRAWNPTRAGALERLEHLRSEVARHYDRTRNLPGEDGTSRLSPYLHWGQLGVREVVAALGSLGETPGGHTYLKELLWRDFGYHILYHFPRTTEQPLQDNFRDFPAEPDERLLQAWQQGRTGYPIVDAGMRQLWETGWMHNRVRMNVASFLVKHLLQPWQAGTRWFWDTLVDADLASNTLGWQWAAGCGADAAPYFRIFNPALQGQKFDPDGSYVRTWVPELKALPDAYLHAPWETPTQLRSRLNIDYPEPIIPHKEGRARALAALETIKGGK